jgi:hypothetical protein
MSLTEALRLPGLKSHFRGGKLCGGEVADTLITFCPPHERFTNGREKQTTRIEEQVS